MKIMILGADGYYGRPLMNRLQSNHEVLGLDNFSRQNDPSLVFLFHNDIKYCDVSHREELEYYVKNFKPEVVIHLAEIRSVPYSMQSLDTESETIYSNTIGMTNVCQLSEKYGYKIIHIGSMGVYGYDDQFEFIQEGSRTHHPISVYHLSKSLDNAIIEYYTRMRGVYAVELHQGTVWGLGGRFDYDKTYGTVVNRFAIQTALGHPLSIYGDGSQTRTFIHIDNSIDCVELVLNTPQIERFEQYNQYTQSLTVKEIADMFSSNQMFMENPRVEKPNNQFKTTNQKLINLGLKVKLLDQESAKDLVDSVSMFLSNVKVELI